MKVQVCAVRDRKIEAFMTPFFVTHIGQAKRSFADECNKKENSAIGAHPEDYDLFHLGEFDDSTARIDNNDVPRLLSVGTDCVLK